MFAAPTTRLASIVLAVVAGSVLAATAVCAASDTPTPSIASAAAMSIESATDSNALQPAVRMSVPAHVEAASAAPIVNQSNCRTGTAVAAMQISIAAISYDCPVYAGGQSTIDGGFVTLVNDRGTSPLLATHPGQAGTLWLAAHRSSHGGAFAAVPSLANGAMVTISDGVTTAVYVVVGRSYVAVRDGLVVDASGFATHDATVDALIRPDHGGNLAPRLLLQTCDGEDHRWMIYADLVG